MRSNCASPCRIPGPSLRYETRPMHSFARRSGYSGGVAAPFMPSPLDYIGRRRFCFYPAIALADPNEWLLGIRGRSEVQAVNAHTGREIWISRQFIGAVSETSNSLLVVGLTQALQFREGALQPRVKQVIEMPADAWAAKPRIRECPHPKGLAPVVAIRLASGGKSPAGRALRSACTGAIVIALLAALVAAAIHF